MRRFARRVRRAKRSVGWIDGFNSMDDASGSNTTNVPLTLLPGAANTWVNATAITVSNDLFLHGGEDAVLVRTIGQLAGMGGLRDTGAGNAAFGFQCRLVIAQQDLLPTGATTPFNFCSVQGLGNDDILSVYDFVVSNTPIGVAGAGYDVVAGGLERWTHLNIKAKRKLQQDRQVFVWFQAVLPAGTMSASFQLLGHLRMLLMRPR